MCALAALPAFFYLLGPTTPAGSHGNMNRISNVMTHQAHGCQRQYDHQLVAEEERPVISHVVYVPIHAGINRSRVHRPGSSTLHVPFSDYEPDASAVKTLIGARRRIH